MRCKIRWIQEVIALNQYYVLLVYSPIFAFIQMKTLTVLACLFLLIFITTSIREERKERPKTIVEANHYRSSTDKHAFYNITAIEKGKPLILLLKKNDKKSSIINEFQISLTENGAQGPSTINCDLKKITDLCIIPKTTSTIVGMDINCKVLPCQLSWIFYQPEVKTPHANEIALNLFSLNDSKDHLIGQITCNDPSVDSLDKDVTVYSESSYKRAYRNNILYVLFNNQEKGFVFINIEEKSRNCARIAFTEAPETIKDGGDVTTNFVTKETGVRYAFAEVPKTDFRLECNSLRLDNFNDIKSSMTISLFGMKGQKQALVAKHEMIVTVERSHAYTVVFKKPSEEYQSMYVEFLVETNQVVLLQLRLATGDPNMAELGEIVFVSLKKGEKMQFKVQGDSDANSTQLMYIIPKTASELTLSKQSCPIEQDCTFSIEATADTENMIYLSSTNMNATYIDPANGKGIYEFQPIEFITLNKKSKQKIRVGDNLFFRKKVKKNQAIQVHINNPNTILYAACQSTCPVPSEKCRERTGNYHHPFVYEAKEDCNFQINVEGLENTQFQLSILDEQKYIQLTDGTPFSYTMDSHQDRIDFKFKLEKKSDVSFNLIAPLNSLKLLVSNEQQLDDESSQQSADGYIFIEKDLVKELQFIVSVVKVKDYQSFFTHFTIIASSKHTDLRLEPAVTSYQTLSPSNFREFIFEYYPSERHILSISTFNLKDQSIDLEVKVSQTKKWEDATARTISKEVDFLDLQEVAGPLCEDERSSCEIFLRVTNKMTIQVDFSLILLMKNAVLELKDGLWQALPENLLTSTTNFYFYPRHQNQNIFISYHSMLEDLRVSYSLWKYDSQEINPAQWPFPITVDEKQQIHAGFKPSTFITIDHQQMKSKCWPSCVLLISFYVDHSSGMNSKDYPVSLYESMNFKIMVSNHHIEIPEKQKMTLTVGKDEDKIMLADLKYAMSKESITFFTNTAIGRCYIKANVYSQKKPICPTSEDPSDFTINIGESIILIDDIKKKLKQKQMQQDNNLYLCLDVHSDSSCKFVIQYSSQSDGFKKIHIDSYEEITLGSSQSKYYQIDGFMEMFAKVTRISGFPFIFIKKCAVKEEYQQCMEDFKNSTEKGKQIVVKTEAFQEQPCTDCIYLFKFSTVEPSKINFHLQSTYAQIQLKENNIMSDYINEGQVSKYLLNANAKEDLIINIHVQEGEVEAQVTNLNSVNLVKKSDGKNKIMHFVVKALDKSETQVGNALINPNALSSDFVIYHVVLKSTNPSKAASFTISYSSGKREVYLQDGLILDYILESNKVSTFYYFNEISSNHVFYEISMDNSAVLNQLKIKAFYLQDPNDMETKQEITLQRPTMSKKTPNPTILFSLPSHNFFIFELTNPASKQQRVSMGINHQEVILLPFNHEFPFQLHRGESLNILVDVNIEGYLEISIKKCDRAQPNLSYTFDYDQFIKGEFLHETVLNEQPYFHELVKANRVGTLYVNFKADIDQDSTLSFKVVHSEEKSKSTKMKAGRKGILQYQLNADRNAKVTVPVALCDNQPCTGVKYYYLTSKVQQDVYSQLVCSSNFFSTNGFNSTQPLTLYKIDGKIANKDLVFDFQMSDPSIYLGIKAVSQSGQEIFYQPIQVASLWAKWQQVSLIQRSIMVSLVLLCLCICVLFVRRASRKGYRQLNETQQ